MTHYEEHLTDQYIDTWQAAEAAQFLKDEADAELNGDYAPSAVRKPLEHLAEVPAMTEAEIAMDELAF
jgi:hypothetical protein|tara:strand:- start:2935 stop:3138 length:204 start_codon:yes stop_codon:yes gene_type:complete